MYTIIRKKLFYFDNIWEKIINMQKLPDNIFICCFIFLLIFFALCTRRIDVIINAQPWAEDGALFIANVYNNGFIKAFLTPCGGYVLFLSDLAAFIGLLFGVNYVAFVMNVLALSFVSAFCMFLLSERFSSVKLIYRLITVLYLITMPNVSELHGNITNIQWYGCLYLMAIIIAQKNDTTFWRIHDYIICFCCSFSGPFSMFISFVYAIMIVIKREKIFTIFNFILFAGALSQFLVLLSVELGLPEGKGIEHPFSFFSGLVVQKILIGTFFQYNVFSISKESLINNIIFITTIIFILYYIYKEKNLKMFFIFIVSILIPLSSAIRYHSYIYAVEHLYNAERYFFSANFCFFLFILYIINKHINLKKIKILSLLFIIILFINIGFTFFIPPLPNVGYHEDIEKFIHYEGTEPFTIRINPPGWKMVLNKK